MIRIRSALAAVVLAGLAVAGCGGAAARHPAGPPRAGALAARLGCRVTGAAQGAGVAAYDTTQDVVASGGQCSDGSKVGALAGAPGPGIDIITFASAAKEADWLHQNAAAEQAGFAGGSGYFEVVSGRLWVIASDGYGALYPAQFVVRRLGGKDTTF
jgi:hypothetical protein